MQSAHQRVLRIGWLDLYTAAISSVGVVLLGLAVGGLPAASWGVAIFIALGLVSELTTSEAIAPQIAFSMSSAVAFAAMLLYGPLAAALVGGSGGLAATLVKAVLDRRSNRRRTTPLLKRLLFNMAAMGLPPAIAGYFYHALGGQAPTLNQLGNILPMTLAAICFELVNGGIVVCAVSLQTRQPALRLWRQNLSWATPMNVLGMVAGGGGLAIGYHIAGMAGVTVFFLPLVLTIYAFQFSVRQTRAQMVRSEETIATRTAELRAANLDLEREIADRRRAEAELRLRAQLLDAATDSIFVYDAAGRCRYANEAASKSHGYDRAQLLSLSSSELTAPEFREAAAAHLEELLAGGEVTYQSANVRRDGSVMPIEVHARTISSEGSRLVLAVVRDITERKRLEDQLRQAQKMETVGRLAGGIAHDFNNLLTAISGYASFAQSGLLAGDPARDDIAQVLAAADSAAHLVRQLLAFSRRQVIAPQLFDLNQLILKLDHMLRRLIGEDVELVTLTARNLATVKADPNQVEQVLVNLAVNARDAMPDGGQLTVETGNVVLDSEYARQHVGVVPGTYVLLAVSDTGCGMSEEVKSRIFEPYFTTKEPGKGTGLGLATCYGIVKQNNGHIAFSSKAGSGTTFKVYLPAVAEPAAAAASNGEKACKVNTAKTVLLAEDERLVRSFVARALRQAGYTVLEAGSGPEAIRLATGHGAAIDLLVSDLVMPQMGGIELSQQVRSSFPGVKTLFISGYSDSASVHLSSLPEGAGYLQKPFTVGALSARAAELLEGTGETAAQMKQTAPASATAKPLGERAQAPLAPAVNPGITV